MRKHRDIELVTTETRRNYLVSEPNYYTTNFFFSENVLATEMKKCQMHMNKLVYLVMSMLELSKIVMYEFWYTMLHGILYYCVILCHVTVYS